ncbi:DUF1871 family protein [Cohnella abietis]|uniref:DUF1871 domain-containing protein n=1 Tax=Cohnella abietis TaxID=2507935 RepID=A0A3T1D799_9BACL|nr:DUF1871 family protein [Cohnella abietis]BBI33953.1 hypothetical protein KCTCHS21_33520 [Cohnella abietis]
MNTTNQIVTRVINDWDPIGLLAGGAPENEYDIEINEIVEKCIMCENETDLARQIYKVFYEKMGIKLNQLTCLKHAFNIIEQTDE